MNVYFVVSLIWRSCWRCFCCWRANKRKQTYRNGNYCVRRSSDRDRASEWASEQDGCWEKDAITKWNRDSISVNFYLLLLLLSLSVSLLFVHIVCLPFHSNSFSPARTRFLWASFFFWMCLLLSTLAVVARSTLVRPSTFFQSYSFTLRDEFSMRNKQHELVAMPLCACMCSLLHF